MYKRLEEHYKCMGHFRTLAWVPSGCPLDLHVEKRRRSPGAVWRTVFSLMRSARGLGVRIGDWVGSRLTGGTTLHPRVDCATNADSWAPAPMAVVAANTLRVDVSKYVCIWSVCMCVEGGM